ncbi:MULTISPECIES: sensor histidine kinase [Actinomadura]|uniref:histidine kinase n=1 Tax=Actinomadura yumaensis TaxID=111807 RepID=A0ABW2CKV9_9ACTN|nr:ATP-binding protein [Actinomadura sp. J1-007]MWK38681.1 hypothetical protein [Actinomadura sp. J1-007]
MTSSAPPPADRAPRWAVPSLAACAFLAVAAAPLLYPMGPAEWLAALLVDVLALASLIATWWLYERHGAALAAVSRYEAQSARQAAELHERRRQHADREEAWRTHADGLAARYDAMTSTVEHLLTAQLPAALAGRPVPAPRRQTADPALASLRDEALDAASAARAEAERTVEAARAETERTVDNVRAEAERTVETVRAEAAKNAEAVRAEADAAADALRADQADLLESQQLALVALSRRVQSAMHRVQAEAATTAERHRDLPEVYGACQVIDHLAAQAARLAQGLAVAAGTWEGQQWDTPMRLAEVVQAAQARIEDYQRVTIEGDPGTAIAPAALEAVIHVLAELLANATESSPTATTVPVKVSAAAQGAVFRIDDHGAGLEEPRLTRARELLNGTREVSLADMGEVPRLGLPVVARYVQRHGLKVTLDESPYGGLQAIVLVPKDLVTYVVEPSHPDATPPSPQPLAPERTPPDPAPPPVPEGTPNPRSDEPLADHPAPVETPPGEDGLLPQRVSPRRTQSAAPTATPSPPGVAPPPETPEQAGALMGALFEGSAQAVAFEPPAPPAAAPGAAAWGEHERPAGDAAGAAGETGLPDRDDSN